jgi:ATP-dependent protease ClpP protease subunit
MKKLLLILTLLLSLGVHSNDNQNNSQILQDSSSYVFSEGNFFPITTEFSRSLAANFTEKILSHQGKELLLYFNSPGGSVIALSNMVRVMKSSNIKFTCIANFAASAAFMLFEHCDNRILLSDGVLMSHNWSGGFAGEAPRILTLFNTVQSIVDDLEAVVINKMSLDNEEYKKLINNNLWMPRSLALKYNAINSVNNNITCQRQLIDKKILLGYFKISFFSDETVAVYRSACPIIQKLYVKNSSGNEISFIQIPTDEVTLAQETYEPVEANLIYMGKRRN